MSKFWTILVVALTLVGGFIALVSIYLPVEDPLVKADAIIAISGGDTEARTEHAIKLYQEGWAPQLIFSGAAKDPASPSNAKVMQEMAIAQGVPESAISIDEFSRDTKENALKTQIFADTYKTVILVTSDYHQRRAHNEFQKTFGSDTTIINSPAEDTRWGQKTWWLTPYGWWVSISEVLKLPFSQ